MAEAGQTILVVDDEPMVREVVCTYLSRDGFSCRQASDGREALDEIEAHPPALVVLDVMLPKLDGFSVLAKVREVSDVPVILLSARTTETDRLLGLELGADDYVVKPFSPREVAVRVRNILKRVSGGTPNPPPVVTAGDLTVDGGSREVTIGGTPVPMPPLEFDLLMCLAGSPRTVFSRAELLERVWGSSAEWQDTSTVTVHIRRLRQKVEEDPNNPTRIATVWGRGYRFEP